MKVIKLSETAANPLLWSAKSNNLGYFMTMTLD